MKQHEERTYRRRNRRPTQDEMRSQLARCRQDYERFRARGASIELQTTLRTKIAELEAELAEAKRAERRTTGYGVAEGDLAGRTSTRVDDAADPAASDAAAPGDDAPPEPPHPTGWAAGAEIPPDPHR